MFKLYNPNDINVKNHMLKGEFFVLLIYKSSSNYIVQMIRII